MMAPNRVVDKVLSLVILVVTLMPISLKGAADLYQGSDDTSLLQALVQVNQRGIANSTILSSLPVDIGALLVDPRCQAAVPVVVWNMRERLPSLPIQIIHSTHNKECMQRWFGNWDRLTLTEIPDESWGQMDHEGFQGLLTTPQFWDKVMHDKVLFFHHDTWVCGGDAEGKLRKFLAYDFVGAPWTPAAFYGRDPPCGGVGNDGFSLRTVKIMHDITARFGQSFRNEDTYFCEHLQTWEHAILPSVEVAGEFSAEGIDASLNGSTLGAHDPDVWPWYKNDTRFQENCPGIDVMRRAVTVGNGLLENRSLAIAAGSKMLHEVQAVGFVL